MGLCFTGSVNQNVLACISVVRIVIVVLMGFNYYGRLYRRQRITDPLIEGIYQ
jgi:hypothetical protein